MNTDEPIKLKYGCISTTWKEIIDDTKNCNNCEYINIETAENVSMDILIDICNNCENYSNWKLKK